MSPSLKAGTVAAGYVTAFLIASAAVAIRLASTSDADAQASGGMYAFGDAFLFVTVFSLSALVPTGAALFFLRPFRRFWTVLSALGVAVAVTGVTAAVLYAIGRQAVHTPLAALAQLSVLRILVSPLLALILILCAVLSPYRASRFALLAATVMETAASLYAGWAWFIPLYFHSP